MLATLDADPIHWRDSKIDLNSSMVERVPEKDNRDCDGLRPVVVEQLVR
jgi:hypothetical protein